MTPRRTIHGLLLIAVLAFVGFLLVYIPPQVIDYYRRALDLGPTWAYIYLGAVGTGALLLLVCSVWTLWQLWSHTRRKREKRERQSKSPSQLSRDQQQQEIDENLAAIADLQTDEAVADEIRRELDPSLARFDEKRQKHKLEIVAFGTISSGKSSLLNSLAGRDVFATDAKGGTTVRRSETPWPGLENVTLVDTPGLGEVDGEERAAISADAAQDADVVLMTVDGPLRDVEHDLLERLGQMEKRVIVCLNKQDWYADDERRRLLGQLGEQAAPVVAAEDVVAVRAGPTTRARVRVLPDGSQAEEQVPVSPDIGPLAERLMQVVRGEGESLLLANLLLQSRGLVEEARNRVRQALDRRAWQIVDRYTWGAAGAAALSPFPLVDLGGRLCHFLQDGRRSGPGLSAGRRHRRRGQVVGRVGQELDRHPGRQCRDAGGGLGRRLAVEIRARRGHDCRRPAAGNRPGADYALDRRRVRDVLPQRNADAAGRARGLGAARMGTCDQRGRASQAGQNGPAVFPAQNVGQGGTHSSFVIRFVVMGISSFVIAG